MVMNVQISLSRLLITTTKLRKESTKSVVGLMNIMKNVVISAFQAMSDAKETTQENVLLNATAANLTILIAVTDPITTQKVIITMLLETEKYYTAMTGAAQKITHTVKEVAFLMPLDYHMVMDQLQTQHTTLKFAVKVRDVVMLERPTSNTSPTITHSVAFLILL